MGDIHHFAGPSLVRLATAESHAQECERVMKATHSSLRLIVASVVVAMLAAAALVAPFRTERARAAGIPAGLPNHLGLGVAAQPDSTGLNGWMPNSGVPWDYAYQYLTPGWETWNANGQFPLSYAQNAASHSYIPVFTYYEIQLLNGSCGGCGGGQKDFANLNNPGLMAGYFQNFALLMQKLGPSGFGRTVIVHVEPDLSGFAQQAVLDNTRCYGYCTGQGNSPSLLRASVTSSGYSGVLGYADTYQGFNAALLHLRDAYAPNVLLAAHISDWATGPDISTSSSLDAAGLGRQAGSFAAQSGSFDLLFNDVSDRDAGYYKYALNNPDAWWDRQNVTFPNFQRWETYVGAASGTAGRSVIVWQIPEGNQYYQTENNSTGHYQDNRAEYFFSHMSELSQAGIIGLLFGAGNGGSTVHYDARADGVTNPAPICNSDGSSAGQICNNHASSLSDDDGGFIRTQAQLYYQGLSGISTPTPTPTSTATSSPTPVSTSTAVASPTPTATAPIFSSPTPTPTLGAVRTPTPTRTPPSSAPVFTASASVFPSTISVGGATRIQATVVDTGGSLSNGIVDIEIVGPAGQKVAQRYFTGQSFGIGQAGTYTYFWIAPFTPGTYTVAVGVFGTNWSPNYYWAPSLASIIVR